MNVPSAEALRLRRAVSTAVGTVLAVSVMDLTMRWISAELVAPLFGYLGYGYVPAPWEATLATVSLTSATALSLPRRLHRASHVVLWTIFVVCVAPTMLMSVSTGHLDRGAALMLTAAVGTAFSAVAVTTPRGPVPAGDARTGPDEFRFGGARIGRATTTWLVCSAYSLVTYGLMAVTVGVHLRLVALDEIYDVRADYTSEVGTGGLLGYLLTGQAYVVNPLVLARGLLQRRPALVALALAGQFLLYSSTGFKAVLFSFVAVLGMAVLFGVSLVPRARTFLVAPLAIMVVSAVADEIQGGITWTSVFTRRFMLTPGLLSSVYVEYFSGHPTARYGYSFLRWWVDYPDELPPPKRIADFLVPGAVGYANANLFADGFANFGWLGIAVAALALLVWTHFLDRATRGLPMRVTAMAVVMPSIMLSNTSIFTAMLSHGLLVGTLLLALAPRTGWTAAGTRGRRSTDAALRLLGGRDTSGCSGGPADHGDDHRQHRSVRHDHGDGERGEDDGDGRPERGRHQHGARRQDEAADVPGELGGLLPDHREHLCHRRDRDLRGERRDEDPGVLAGHRPLGAEDASERPRADDHDDEDADGARDRETADEARDERSHRPTAPAHPAERPGRVLRDRIRQHAHRCAEDAHRQGDETGCRRTVQCSEDEGRSLLSEHVRRGRPGREQEEPPVVTHGTPDRDA